MIPFIASVFILSALAFTILCFVFVSRPDKLLGILVLFSGEQEAWHSGRIDGELEKKHYEVAKRIEWLIVFALFGWSVLCGALLAYAQLIQL
ncbi:MAG: hypothetical protein VX278_16190 [Myxococcota bacterium]|nr:hypothetical protein [Myxococcota bacterium]